MKRVLYRVLPLVVALLLWAALPDGFSHDHPWRLVLIMLALNIENVMGYWECANRIEEGGLVRVVKLNARTGKSVK